MTLLQRGNGPVTLTAAGQVLLGEGKVALAAVAAAVRRTQRAAHPDPRLVLAIKPGADGGLLPDILAAYRRMPGALPVDVVCSFGERAAMLRDGRADAAMLYGPREDITGFATEELLTEDQVVVLPQGHRLARRETVSLADLRGQTMPRWPHLPADGADGPEVHDAGELMQLIALGQVVAVLPESVRSQLRHDLVCIPVTDAPAITLLLAWPEAATSLAMAKFVQAATERIKVGSSAV